MSDNTLFDEEEYNADDIYGYLEDFNNRIPEIINNSEKIAPDKKR
jgi:hypothetical protein